MEIFDILNEQGIIVVSVIPAPILMDEYLSGPQGMNFVLYPEHIIHNQDDIEIFKTVLRRTRDVVSIRVEWLSKGNAAAMTPSETRLLGEIRGIWITRLNKSGYAGILAPDGWIVDRRRYKDAIPIQENKSLGVAKPKEL
jgi:hypothetical protein